MGSYQVMAHHRKHRNIDCASLSIQLDSTDSSDNIQYGTDKLYLYTSLYSIYNYILDK